MASSADRIRTDFGGYQPKHFDWSLDGKVATITLNRPERKIRLTFESYAELRETFRDLAHADAVKAVVIVGAAGNFCSGGDVHEIIGPLVFMQEAGDMQGLLDFTHMTGDLVKAMRACPQVIVAAVDGICAGAGAIIAWRPICAWVRRPAGSHSCSCASVSPAADMGAVQHPAAHHRRRPSSRIVVQWPIDGRRGSGALGLLQPLVRTGNAAGPRRMRSPHRWRTARHSLMR